MYRFLLVILPVAFSLSLLFGCGKPAGNDKEAKISSSESGELAKDKKGHSSKPQPMATFDPAMLLTSERAAKNNVEFPQIRVLMEDKTPQVLVLTIVAECTNSKTRKELKSHLSEMQTMITDLLATKRPQYASSLEGKMKIKEEIIAKMKEQMENKGIREIYFSEYSIAPAKK